jgi:predicted flap endonuclease-1-like 5' DNA nuclease
MAESLPTVRIADDTGGYLVINEADFDSSEHTRYREPETDAAQSDDDQPDELALTLIDGIGKARAAKLSEELSVSSLADLLTADVAALAATADVSEDAAQAWLKQARALVSGA